ncbi:hypothetical protein H0H87_005928 [Tephrocybe sp. NHM501043]|nr:hypothetical protein H0H87_005928 [Tephrocybe sp. NHM501043]
MCQHYKIYLKHCEENSIPAHDWAIPHSLWREKQAEDKKVKLQKEGIVVKEQSRLELIKKKEFSRDEALKQIAQLIACDNQDSVRELGSLGPGIQRCTEHVVQLAIQDVMSSLTKTAAIENATAIWEYNPDLPGNRVLNGRLDVIAAICTIAIKIQASRQRIKYFHSLQTQTGTKRPLKIPLYNNNGERLSAITCFIASADAMFVPITTICKDGHIEKHIKWAAFSLNEKDWQHIEDAQEILFDAKKCLHHFSSDQRPTLYKFIPATEALLTAWEKKQADPQYCLYDSGIGAGCSKLLKYYNFMDDKPAILLLLLIHPYYSIDYIWVEWGGEEEQLAEVAKGNFDAINWVEKAKEVMEQVMALYWTSWPQATATAISKTTDTDNENDDSLSEFDCLCCTLVSANNQGWEAELHSYFKDVHADVDKNTDIVKWCKQTATDWCLCLGPEVFEELQILKAVWKPTIVNLAYENAQEIKVINENDNMKAFSTFLDEESALEAWEWDLDTVHD